MKILGITGYRGGVSRSRIEAVFDSFQPALVLHGDAGGVDRQADEIALERGVYALRVPALWNFYRSEGRVKAAGPCRNEVMVYLAKMLRSAGATFEWHAFPVDISPGTRGCVRLLHAAGFQVVVHEATSLT